MKKCVNWAMWIAMAIVPVALTSCDKENDTPKVTESIIYTMGIGGTEHSAYNHSDKGIYVLQEAYSNLIAEKNQRILPDGKYFEVSGSGDTREAAIADADAKATKRFEETSAAFVKGCKEIEASFLAKRKELAEKIKESDPKENYIHSNLGYYLIRGSIGEEGIETLKDIDVVTLEAVGGEDYSK